MKPAALLAVTVLLCSGCTASYVSGEAIASNKAVEAETNNTLVTNILRARDGVPTYYSDISHLRGSLQAQASISAPLGVGDYKNWTGRSIVSPGAYVQVNPSFDMAPLNTQGFTRGINEPLDIRVFRYYLDRAIPPYYNVSYDDQGRDCGLRPDGTGERYFNAKISGWTRPYLFVNAYKLLLPYGPPIPVGAGKEAPGLQDFGGAGNPNVTLRPVGLASGRAGAPPGAYRYYTVSNNLAFCVGGQAAARTGHGQAEQDRLEVTVRSQDGSRQETQGHQVIRIARNTVGNTAATISESVDPSACVKREVYADYETPDRQAAGSYTVLHFRSVDGMIEFLGRMLRVPPRLRPLRFDISPDDPATSRFSVPYGGLTYHVHDRQHRLPDLAGCEQGAASPRCEDRTLEILTLVNQLLNLNKSQNELPATGVVQVVN